MSARSATVADGAPADTFVSVFGAGRGTGADDGVLRTRDYDVITAFAQGYDLTGDALWTRSGRAESFGTPMSVLWHGDIAIAHRQEWDRASGTSKFFCDNEKSVFMDAVRDGLRLRVRNGEPVTLGEERKYGSCTRSMAGDLNSDERLANPYLILHLERITDVLLRWEQDPYLCDPMPGVAPSERTFAFLSARAGNDEREHELRRHIFPDYILIGDEDDDDSDG